MTLAVGKPGPPPAALRKVALASMIGTTIEWYDFFLYGSAAALVFNKLFFPTADPLTGTLLAFSTYALGFVARPLGGLVFGHFGDRIGRKTLLTASLLLMGGSTFLIGLLPTFAQAGAAAPLGLLALRLVQGFAVGGEWGGAVLMVFEHGEAKNRGFWSGWPQAGVPAGNLLAALVLAVMSATQTEADFMAWGWRAPFLLSAALIAVGYWVRSTLGESPAFERAARTDGVEAIPALEALKRRPGGVALGMGLRIGENTAYYVITAFSITYITEVAHLGRGVALNALLAGSAAEVCAIPLLAALSDRIGRRPILFAGSAGMAAFGFVFFRLLGSGAAPFVVLGVVLALLLHGFMYAPQAAFIAELFPTRVRYSGASLAYQATSIVAGSLAPIVSLSLFRFYRSALPVAVYLMAACALGAFAAARARETSGLSLAEIDAESG